MLHVAGAESNGDVMCSRKPPLWSLVGKVVMRGNKNGKEKDCREQRGLREACDGAPGDWN